MGVKIDELMQKYQKRCPKTVLRNVLQDRPFGLVSYFKYIVLKCGHLNMLTGKIMHTNAGKLASSMFEWLQRITSSSQFFHPSILNQMDNSFLIAEN